MKTASQGSQAIAPVGDFYPPLPYVQARMQPEGDVMAEAALLSFPDKTSSAAPTRSPASGPMTVSIMGSSPPARR